MKANDQERLLSNCGITMLSEKAEVPRTTKVERDAIKEEEYRIKAIEEANARIEKSIGDLERQKIWRDQQTFIVQGSNTNKHTGKNRYPNRTEQLHC